MKPINKTILLEDFINYIGQLYSYGHINSNIKETIIGDIQQFKYEEYDIDPDNKDEDYLALFNNEDITLYDYEKYTQDNDIISLIGIFMQNEYEDTQTNRGIDEDKNFNNL